MAGKAGNTETQEVESVTMTEDLAAILTPLLMGIPEGTGSGEDMLKRLLEATTVEELDLSGSLPSAQTLAPFYCRVASLTRHESTMGGAVPWYLVAEGSDPKTGEVVRFQTSAGVPFIVLTKLHGMGLLPANVKITKAEKETRNGYRPLNVEILGTNVD